MDTRTETEKANSTVNGVNGTHVNPDTLQETVIYYGVYVPREDANWSESQDQTHVYTNKTEAINVFQKYKKSRFKSFKTNEEATAFAKHGNEQTFVIEEQAPSNKRTIVEEKSSNFKAPKHQEIIRFKKLIESGDIATVRQTAWENPRYLVSSGDTPLVLQEGSRYNALHVAIRASCRAEMCEMILNTVGNPEFMKLLDGENQCANYLDRAQIMLDLYLNTPDKGLNETPLHFAVKFGLKEVVQVLVSYGQCLKTARNKCNQIPANIICSRKCQEDENLKREILAMLDEQYYVPVLRSEDNTMQPSIGEPFSPTSPLQLNLNPISPRIEVRAIAGPMSKDQATEFRKKWKTPPRMRNTRCNRNDISFDDSFTTNSPLINMSYRLQDTEKGLERVGRDLAKEYHVAWKEYWPFLDAFADFTTNAGLEKLENFLEKKFNYFCNFNTEESKAGCIHETEGSDTCEEINDICQKFKRTMLDIVDNSAANDLISVQRRLFNDINDNDDELEFYTPPSSPRSSICSSDDDDDMYLAEEGPMTFIRGQTVSKLDHAVYQAISSVSLDPDVYPYIYRWRHQIQLVMSQEPLRFEHTPVSTRRRIFASPSPSPAHIKTLNYY